MSNDAKNNSVCCSSSCFSVLGYIVAIVVSILIVAALNFMMRDKTKPVEDASRNTRAAERKAELHHLQTNTVAIAKAYGEPDANGIQRIPVARAMQLIVSEYEDPKAGPATLHARVNKSMVTPSFE